MFLELAKTEFMVECPKLFRFSFFNVFFVEEQSKKGKIDE
eukprot:UN15402